MTGANGPIGEDDLQAFIDERLSDTRRGQVEAYLAENPETVERVTLDRAHRDGTGSWFLDAFDFHRRAVSVRVRR